MSLLDEMKEKYPNPKLEDFDPKNVEELGAGLLGVFFETAVGLADDLARETSDFLRKIAKKQWFLMQGVAQKEISKADYQRIRVDHIRMLENFLIYKSVLIASAIDDFLDALLDLFNAAISKLLGGVFA